jgi:hypothetical protein
VNENNSVAINLTIVDVPMLNLNEAGCVESLKQMHALIFDT